VRITLDLDAVSQLRFLMAYFNLRRFTDKIEVYYTSSEDGKDHYHIVAYDLPDIPFDKLCEFRLALGDDFWRVWLDGQTYKKPKQVLFTNRCKWDRKDRRWVRGERLRILNVLWKPWCSRLPARKPNIRQTR